MAKEFLTDEQVEMEIDRLLHSDAVRLAKLEIRIKNRRRQYMYSLRTMERRGKQLANQGITMERLLGMESATLAEEAETMAVGAE